MKKNRIEWLSILQGWSMFLVVIGHVTLTNIFEDPETPIASSIEKIIYSFHMPLFMFISGFLFYFTKILKEKDSSSIIKDKARRLLIPYIFFTFSTFFLKYFLSSLMKNPVSLSLREIFDIVTFTSNPLVEMWFISTLFIIFLLYPLYKWTMKNKIRIIVLLFFLFILNIFFPKNINIFQLSKVANYIFYFYIGILFSKYEIYLYLNNWKFLVINLALFMISSLFFPIPLILSISGIMFSVCLCLFFSKYIPSLFNSFRDYTFQIFLIGIFFQMSVRHLYTKIGMEQLYWPLYIVSVFVGIYAPVCIAKVISKIKYPTIRLLFGL